MLLRSFALLSVLALQCGANARLPPPFEARDLADFSAVQATVAARLGTAELGAVRVQSSWRWVPAEGQLFRVFSVCRGAGDSRACAVVVAREEGTTLRFVDLEACGWSPPTVGFSGDRGQLVFTGDDGRGGWRQLLVHAGNNTVRFSRRLYQDGM